MGIREHTYRTKRYIQITDGGVYDVRMKQRALTTDVRQRGKNATWMNYKKTERDLHFTVDTTALADLDLERDQKGRVYEEKEFEKVEQSYVEASAKQEAQDV